jgi:seryl-tRNA synthetase
MRRSSSERGNSFRPGAEAVKALERLGFIFLRQKGSHAILENFLEADGRVRVPECLHRWYGGETIGVAK